MKILLRNDRQKASTRISKMSVGRCYCFCDSSVVAKWLYGSYPQGGRAMEAWCGFFVQEKRKFFVLNKELENEKKQSFKNCLKMIWWFVKLDFLNGKNAWLTFY